MSNANANYKTPFITDGVSAPKNKPIGVRYDIYVDLENYRDILETELNVKLSLSDVIGKLLYDQLAEK